ncbi:MAG: hypothetical protein GY788_32760 [bacterium]|nr:hypothetical protein [bacterium]
MASRRLVQMSLTLDGEALWERLPREAREPSTDLLGQLLRAVLTMEKTEEASSERETDSTSS